MTQGSVKLSRIICLVAISYAVTFLDGVSVCAADNIPVNVPAGEVRQTLDVSADAADIKSAVNIRGTVKDAQIFFTQGSLDINNLDSYNYSSILVEAGGLINKLTAGIDGTVIQITGGKEVSGALIKAIGEIAGANLDIKNNEVSGNGTIIGALVEIETTGKIGQITGAGFNSNDVTISGADITGGLIYNRGELVGLSNTNVKGNTATSDTGNVYGGVISNASTISGDIKGVTFEGNNATSTSGNVNGGVLHNTGIFNGKIVNSTFKNNTATSTKGTAHGGAIYSTTDVSIAGDNGTTLIQGNKVVDSSGTRNEAIYIDSRIAKLTLDAQNNGKVLIYDDIDGYDGYSLILQGDNSGKIGLYGNINNANVTVNGGNIDFVNGVISDFNFGQFTSSDAARYSIDLDVASGKADNFVIGTGSSGKIIIDNINAIGDSYDSKLIQIIRDSGTSSVELVLTDKAINAFNSTENKVVTWNDEIPSDLTWGEYLYTYKRNDLISKAIEAVASVYGGKNDSIQYTVTTQEGETTSSVMGDTLRLMNQANSTSDRNFRATESRNSHTVTENLGSTGTGTFNIVGVKDTEYGDITSTIDADGHSLFVLDKASTLGLSDIKIINANSAAGSVFNIKNANAIVNLNNVLIDGTNGTNGIINQGKINYIAGTNDLYTTVTGASGTISLTSGNLNIHDDITQKLISILGGSVVVDNGVSINSQISNAGKLDIYGNSINGAITNNGTMNLYGGTVNSAVSGTGRTYINGTVTANERLGNNITMNADSILNISADDVGGSITQYGNLTNNSTINLTGGTLNYGITGDYGILTVTGDVIVNSAFNSRVTINKNSSVRVNATNMGGILSGVTSLVNNGTLYLTGGTFARSTSGSGSVHIVGDVKFYETNNSSNVTVGQNVIIDALGKLTTGAARFTGGTVTNNGSLVLTDGTLSRTLSGSGTTTIDGSVISNVNMGTKTDILKGSTLTISASNIGGSFNNSGTLALSGGTLSKAISGSGSTKITANSTIAAAINQAISINNGLSVNFLSADYIGGTVTGSDNSMTLGSGTLSHAINNVRVTTNGDIHFADGGAISTFLTINSGSNVWAKASQLGGGGEKNINGSLHLGNGTLAGYYAGSGKIYIEGNVVASTSDLRRLAPSVYIADGGIFTAAINDKISSSLTNNGVFNLSGTLNRNVAGSGTTNINKNVTFTDNAGISGTLNFNNGTLNTQDAEIGNYSIGKAQGSGSYNLDIDVASKKADTLTLGSGSNAVIAPNITLLNVSGEFSNVVYQILKGSTGAKLSLAQTSMTVPIINREEDFINSANVYADQTYQIRDQKGTGTLKLGLTQTSSANDSLLLSLSNILWGDVAITQKDLFHDWLLNLFAAEVNATTKNFNFRKATDVYRILDDEYTKTITSGQTYNINGVADGTKLSRIDFYSSNNTKKYVGFTVNSGGKLNLSDVDIYGAGHGPITGRTLFKVNSGANANFDNVNFTNNNVNSYLIRNYGTINNFSGVAASNGSMSNLLRNEGNINNVSVTFDNVSGWSSMLYNAGTIGSSGGAGIINSVFKNSSLSQNGAINAGILGNASGRTIYNIIDTQFLNNRITNSKTSYSYGIGLNNQGTIQNMKGLTFNGNYISNSSTGESRGAGLYNSGTITNGIVASDKNRTTFSGNHLNTAGAYGAALYNSGTIKVIDSADFKGNYIIYNPNVNQHGRGGAIYNGGAITNGIANSTFDGNYVKLTQSSVIDNAIYSVYGGAIYNNSSSPLSITNSTFKNNYVYNLSGQGYTYGGALYGAYNISGDTVFENNYLIGNAGQTRGGAIFLSGGSIDGNVRFINNNVSATNSYYNRVAGGAIFAVGSISKINASFIGNRAGYGGAIYNEAGISQLFGYFSNNYASGNGGALRNSWSGHIANITAEFEKNHAANGGAIANDPAQSQPTKGIDSINGSIFTGNYAIGSGGAIYSYSNFINEIVSSEFSGNYVNSTGTGYGGALYSASTAVITDGIWNSVFKNNYVSGKTGAYGGAIYTNKDLTIGAKDGGTTEFSGNYVQVNGGSKNSQAVYMDSASSTLTLKAITKGNIKLNDAITGASGFNTNITGDGTGTVQLFNNITNSNITASNVIIDTVNNSIFNYNFLSFKSDSSLKYAIDVDLTNSKADNFTLGYGSSGVIKIDDLNFIGSTNENKIFQIVNNNRSDVQLEFTKNAYGNYKVVDNLLEDSIPDTVYSDDVFTQEKGIILTTTNTYHDSIQVIVNEILYNNLDVIASKETSAVRNFIFAESVPSVTLSQDLSNITGGTFNITGLADGSSIIDANGHKLFNLTNETTLGLSNVTLTGTEDLITVSNAYTKLNLNNTVIDGNIKGQSKFTINFGGESNVVDGRIINATANLNSGELTINKDTFADSGTKLVANGGSVNLQNDTVENVVINNLESKANANYKIDIGLGSNITSDVLQINDSKASGVVTINDVNYLGSLNIEDVGTHVIKVLDTTSDAISVAVSESLQNSSLHLGDIQKSVDDAIAMVTTFNHVYYNRTILGEIVGKLSTSSDHKDSLILEAVEQWNGDSILGSPLGDTLNLVATADMPVRILQAESSIDIINVGKDIGKVSKGELTISGVNDGNEISTIDLAGHKGFVLGKDTALSINSTKIVGNDTPIEIEDSSAVVTLNDANLSGGIKSNTSYTLKLIGNGTTIVSGTLTNANATLSQGGFIFNKDAFAGTSTLNVNGGSILLNDGKAQEYVFNNLISNSLANYSIDIDFGRLTADTLNVKSGSGVVSLYSISLFGTLIDSDLNKDYEVKVIKNNGNPIVLVLSDVLLSQVNDNFKLGSSIITENEEINPITSSTYEYSKTKHKSNVYGLVKVNGLQDGLILTPKRIEPLSDSVSKQGDTLRLWSQLETKVDRHFNFDNPSKNEYLVTENLGTTTAGNLFVNGNTSTDNLSIINANGYTLFDLQNESKLNISDVQITNGRSSTGSIFNIVNSKSIVNLDNIVIDSIGNLNGIYNAGTLNVENGNNIVNTGIAGSGVLNINNGSTLTFGKNSNISQSKVNVNNGSLILDVSDSILGSLFVNQQGSAKLSASAISQNVTNEGKLNLLNGSLISVISGLGSTDITGQVEARAAINQKINVASSGTLTTNASNIGGNINNLNDIYLTGGTLSKNISGSGITNVLGVVSSNGLIAQNIVIDTNGSLTTDASNVGGLVTNNRELYLTGGELAYNVNGNGRTYINNNLTLNSSINGNTIYLDNAGIIKFAQNSDISNSTLNVLSGGVDLTNNTIAKTNLGDLILNDDMHLMLDADLSKKTADILTSNSITNNGDHSIIVDSIDVIADAKEDLPFEVKIADNVLASNIKLAADLYVHGNLENTNYLVSYSKDTGNLKFEYGSLSTAILLSATERQYNLAADENSDLGVENGDNSILSVFGHNHAINVNNQKQWVIGTNKTVKLNDVGKAEVTVNPDGQTVVNVSNKGFNGANTTAILVNGGTLETSESVFTENSSTVININNGGKFSAENIVVYKNSADNGVINNSGTIQSIKDSQFIDNTSKNTAGAINNSGTITFNGTNTFANNSTVSNGQKVANDIYNTGNINVSENGTLNINGGISGSNGRINLASGSTLNMNGAFDGNTVNLNNSSIILGEAGSLNLTGLTTTVNGGVLNVQNGQFENSSIGNASLAGLLNVSIDINSKDRTSDKFIANASSTGVINITDLNLINGAFENITDADYKIQILDAANNNIQLSLSDEVIDLLGGKDSHRLGQYESYETDDAIKQNTSSTDVYYHRYFDEYLRGTIGLTSTNTANDSIGVVNGEVETVQTAATSRGDTLALVNQSSIADRTFNFDKTNNSYTASSNIGTTGAGGFTINGKSEGSTINLNNYTGFNVENGSSLTINNIKVINAKGADVTNAGTVTLSGSSLKNISNDGTVNISGSNVDNINGSGTTSVKAGDSIVNQINQNVLNTAENSKLTINSSSKVNNLSNAGQLEHKDKLTLNSGKNTGKIVSTSGELVLAGNYTNSNVIDEKNLTINAGSLLTNESTGNITVDTTLTNNSSIKNDGSITIKGTNTLGSISGEGTLTADGKITVNKDIKQTNVKITEDASLTNNAQITATLSNLGQVTSSATNILGNVGNDGTLILTGGTYGDYEISGTGTTNVTENLTNNGVISQGSIILNAGKVVTNNGEITSAITNNGEIKNNNKLAVKGGQNNGIISGNSILEVLGTFTNSNVGTITQREIINSGILNNIGVIAGSITNLDGGILESLASNLQGSVVNNGTLNLLGGFTQGELTGVGTINVNGALVVNHSIRDNKLVLNTDVTLGSDGQLSLGGLTANGGDLQAQNNKIDSLGLGDVVLNDDFNISIDADLANEAVDTISGTSITSNGHSIIVESINVLTDAEVDMPLDIIFADSVLKDFVKLSTETIGVLGVKEGVSYLVTYSSENGKLTFKYGDLESAVQLPASERNYSMAADEIVSRDLGIMQDGKDILSINGNGFKIISENNTINGITVNSGNVLNINNVSTMQNFNVALNNASDGTINISNTSFENNKTDIINAGTLTFAGVNKIDKVVGEGSTTIKDGKTTVNVELTQSLVDVKEKSVLENNGKITSELNNAGIVTNNKLLNILAGQNSGVINGSGDIVLDGDYLNTNEIIQNLITIANENTLTNEGKVTASINNMGNIINNNTLGINGGENKGNITGSGNTVISGDFSNDGTLLQYTISINDEKTLTNEGSVTANINNAGTIINNNKLNINGGENKGSISGNGNIIIAGDFTNNSLITQNTIKVNGNNTLTNNDKIVADITNDGSINSSASNLIGDIINNGTLNISGGQTQGVINGTNGTINVGGNFTISNDVSGNHLNLNSGTTSINNGVNLDLDGLTANGGALNLLNSNKDTIDFKDVVLNSDMDLSLDVDLENKWGDYIQSDSVSGEGNIIIDNINIIAESKDKMPVSVNIADDELKSHIKLDDNFVVNTGDDVKDSYFISYDSEDGVLNFEYASLSVAIKSETEQKVYVMNKDEMLGVDAGELNGTSLSINGNGSQIIGTGNSISLKDDQTLSLNKVTVTGFDSAIDNKGGVVNVTDTIFTNNKTDVANNGTLNIFGQTSINKVIGADGTLNINSYEKADGTIVNAEVVLNEYGSIEQKNINIQDNNKLVNNGTITTEVLNNKGNLENNKNLSVVSGTNSGQITGSGQTNISGKYQNDGYIAQETLNVSDSGDLTTSLENIITKDNKITNSGTLHVLDGKNQINIEGNGTTEINGEVVNNAEIKQSTVKVAQDGELTTSLDKLDTTDIQVSGILNVTDNKINKDISGTETGVINLNQSLTLDSTIKGAQIALNNNSTISFGDKVNLSGLSNFVVNGGSFNMVDKNADNLINLGSQLTLNKDLDLSVDVDLANRQMDRITADSVKGNGFINVISMNMLSEAENDTTRVEFATDELKDSVKTSVKTTAFSPIWKYGVEYDKQTGEFVFVRGFAFGGGGISSFNPAVLASPIATQVGGYAAMNESLNYAFKHSDTFSALPASQRLAAHHANQYAIEEAVGPYKGLIQDNAIWMQPYAVFENIRLNNGPDVNVTSYGTMVGSDGKYRKLNNGWDTVNTTYIGYNGSNQSYLGVSTTQNGGLLGTTQTFYKDNLFTAITASVGAGVAESSTMYGAEDYAMLMAGVASKTGYNFEFQEGRYIIQPSMLLSYTFVNTFDYTNAAGVSISSDPLNTIQLRPGMKFVANFKNGWQPYASVGMSWNIMNDTKFTVNNYPLPEMSIKPYVEYGIGVQKTWKDKFTGYLQSMIRNGGRRGILLSFGFRWTLGKEANRVETVQNKQKKEMFVKLKSNKSDKAKNDKVKTIPFIEQPKKNTVDNAVTKPAAAQPKKNTVDNTATKPAAVVQPKKNTVNNAAVVPVPGFLPKQNVVNTKVVKPVAIEQPKQNVVNNDKVVPIPVNQPKQNVVNSRVVESIPANLPKQNATNNTNVVPIPVK